MSVILDEVQRVPELLPAIKSTVDRKRTPGRFLLTGSANLLLLPRVRESPAGRVEIVRLHPLTEMEKQGCKKSLLKTLLDGHIKTDLTATGSSLSGDLGIDRQTTEKYVGILEKLFLVRRLPAWHGNQGKRLVRTPKIHVVDSGLAATLNRLAIDDWRSQSTEFGPLLESFAVQQLVAQAGWVDNDLAFSYYRDKDKVEVDLVIEQGRKVWGVEVKRAATLQKKDGAGLARLASQAGKNFQGGILLYSGTHCLPLATSRCFAVPLNMLWNGQ